MKDHKALWVFISTSGFTLSSCILEAIPQFRDSMLGAFAILGLFGTCISFLCALVEAFNNK